MEPNRVLQTAGSKSLRHGETRHDMAESIPKERQSRLDIGDLAIDRGSRTVKSGVNDVRLATAEFELLWLLAENAGRVLSRDEIYTALRGFEHDGLERSMDLRVARLRKKLGDNGRNPRRIISIRSVGYLYALE